MFSGIVGLQFPAAPIPPPPAPGEAIRVGFVSGFFINHSNWKMPIKGWLSQLDSLLFQAVRLSSRIGARCRNRRRRRDVRPFFVQLPLNVAGWRREILADAPHVLIYPGILMDTISTQLAALRLAPVQCNSVGASETSGLPTLDYCISQAI